VITRSKTPRTPPDRLTRDADDVIDHAGILWRIHRTAGEHVLPWNGFRTFGPLPSMRWEPHPGERPTQCAEGVLYAAGDVTTCLAEVYQDTRVIDTYAAGATLTGWQPLRPLRLLDLSGTWPLRNSASAALSAAPRAVSRRWARAIRTAWPDIDGLSAPSTMTGRRNVVLWSPAADSLPDLPEFSRPLSTSVVWSIVHAAATEIGYRVL